MAEFLQSHYDDLWSVAAGKPVALGEIGRPPSLDSLKSQPKWAWFMGWSDIFDRQATDAHKALFADPERSREGTNCRKRTILALCGAGLRPATVAFLPPGARV